MTVWAETVRLTLRVIEVGGDSAGDLDLVNVRLEAGPDPQHMTHPSDTRCWSYWAFHLENTLGIDHEVVDQARKRLQVDHDHYVDIPILGPVFLHQLGMEPIEQG